MRSIKKKKINEYSKIIKCLEKKLSFLNFRVRFVCPPQLPTFVAVTDPLVIYSAAQLLCWCVRRRSFFGHLSRLTLSGSNLTTAQHSWYLKPPGNRLMGISRAHESVPRSFSLVHGTDPCTTEDLPLSVVLFLNNLATLSAQLNTLHLL